MMALLVTSVIYLLFFGLLLPPGILENSPAVDSVAMSLSLALAVAIIYEVSGYNAPSIAHPRTPLNRGRDPDYLALWVWQYLQHG